MGVGSDPRIIWGCFGTICFMGYIGVYLVLRPHFKERRAENNGAGAVTCL